MNVAVSSPLARALDAVREQGTAWLLYNIYHRDHVADALLGVDPSSLNTRPWWCLIEPDGTVTIIRHAIEQTVVPAHAGTAVSYDSRAGLLEHLRALGQRQPVVAMNVSSAVPALSMVDHGCVLTVQEAGLAVQPAETLIQRTLGVLSPAQRASHERAAAHLYAVVPAVWQHLAQVIDADPAPTEGQVQRWILDQLDARGLETEEPPLVAVGAHSADPHYQPVGAGSPIEREQVVQLDLWAREPGADGVYADISWLGYTATVVAEEVAATFAAARDARDEVVAFISERVTGDGAGAADPPTGAQADAVCRAAIARSDLLSYTCHRTGHAIDRRLHGIGVNLDSVEFPDPRPLLDGSCFSIEPGIYRQRYGVRTEINAYVDGNRLRVSGDTPQREVLHL